MIATADVGSTIVDLLQQDWSGTRIVELESAERISPTALAAAFSKALGKPVRTEAVPREKWEAIFRDQGMRNPLPRMQMIDGFNEGWIDFADKGANARKGSVSIETAIAALVAA